MYDIVLVDLFSGVGGFAKGLEEAGFNIVKHYFSEIDKKAISVYKYHFKDAEYLGSVVDVSGSEIRRKHPGARIVISFGWPCQDNSIAGKRKGHGSGTRSSLLLEAVRIIQEVQPFCFLAENVKGLYSVNEGVDFIEAIRLLTFLDSDSPQYTIEQQLLNTLWYIPQNRERTYFVGYPTSRGFRSVLPITKGNETFGNKKNSGNTRNIAGTISTRNQSPQMQFDGSTTLIGVTNKNGRLQSMEVSTSIDASYHKGMDNHGQRTMVISDSGKGRAFEKRDSVPPLRSNKGEGYGNYIEITSHHNRQGDPSKGGTGPLKSDKYSFSIDRIPHRVEVGTLRTDGSGQPVVQVMDQNIRRLTEIECERLQGFQDNWTLYGLNEKDQLVEISSTQRYKQMGNAVSVPVVKAVGQQIINKLF